MKERGWREGAGIKGRKWGIKDGKGKIYLMICFVFYLFFPCWLVHLLIQPVSQKYQSAIEHKYTHTFTHSDRSRVISFFFFVEETFEWGAQNNSIRPKLDWCSTGRRTPRAWFWTMRTIRSLWVTHIHSIKHDSESFCHKIRQEPGPSATIGGQISELYGFIWKDCSWRRSLQLSKMRQNESENPEKGGKKNPQPCFGWVLCDVQHVHVRACVFLLPWNVREFTHGLSWHHLSLAL